MISQQLELLIAERKRLDDQIEGLEDDRAEAETDARCAARTQSHAFHGLAAPMLTMRKPASRSAKSIRARIESSREALAAIDLRIAELRAENRKTSLIAIVLVVFVAWLGFGRYVSMTASKPSA
eukprot:c12993_g1_i1.p1 GENE.c12993_g1_i1~~c12993_g1_i1.p1  ORF type:complete len:124 (-),score=8.56 c12993_g1_i1:300-671(-)